MMIVYGIWQLQLKWMRCNEQDGLTFSFTFASQLAREFNAMQCTHLSWRRIENEIERLNWSPHSCISWFEYSRRKKMIYIFHLIAIFHNYISFAFYQQKKYCTKIRCAFPAFIFTTTSLTDYVFGDIDSNFSLSNSYFIFQGSVCGPHYDHHHHHQNIIV